MDENDKDELLLEKLMQEEEETLMNEEEELEEEECEPELTREEIRLKMRIEKFFKQNEGRDVVDVVGELVVRMEDLEALLEEHLKVEKDDWKRQGTEL